MDSAFCIAPSETTPSNVTINGLYLENFAQWPIWTQSPNTTIINNIVNNSYNLGIVATGSPTNVVVAHNYVTNTAFHGIEVEVCSACSGVNEMTVANNFVYNTCRGSPYNASNCGPIYAIDHTNNTAWATIPLKIVNNYIRDGYATGGGSRGIYINDGTSNVQVAGNIVSGIMLYENQLHGGSNDSWTGNIIDLENNMGAPIQFYQNDGTSSMTNNTFSNNIIVASMNGSTGAGYLAGNSPPTPLAISNNAYWNYPTGANFNYSGSGGSGSSGDSNATYENPNFTCGWEYTLPSNSPVYSPPVNFPMQPVWGQPGFWGPPGFTIPQVGTAPSPPHNC